MTVAALALQRPYIYICMKRPRTSLNDVCSICLDLIDEMQCVHLHCNHTFHGQCIATALQLDRRCPLCRECPAATSHDNDEPFEEGFNDAVAASVVRIMSKIPTRLVRQLLRIFDVRVSSFTPRMLATALSEQLHYETDSDLED